MLLVPLEVFESNIHGGVSYGRGNAVESNIWCIFEGHCLCRYLETRHYFPYLRAWNICTHFYR